MLAGFVIMLNFQPLRSLTNSLTSHEFSNANANGSWFKFTNEGKSPDWTTPQSINSFWNQIKNVAGTSYTNAINNGKTSQSVGATLQLGYLGAAERALKLRYMTLPIAMSASRIRSNAKSTNALGELTRYITAFSFS